ncbi:murein L,D-transpeptidase catalytic domain family protein [Sphingomonas sp.]|uniref:murein L,D-transpeptidase catalytic domain family protein n=1 Tax=Sphingomonas sp. TaxID=28214 RepID=UPI002D80329F|nr:murein L,D-transpeptidase catalytic domain family protein [Sphingomonas sp.]HEU0044198.1 murein L,D-transpeptidase catalytic domain family protein [Sphingomonas sp.]
MNTAHGRRAVLKNGMVLAGVLAVPGAVSATVQRLTQGTLMPRAQPLPSPMVPAAPVTSAKIVRPQLLRRALASLDAQGSGVARDRIAIADFASPSAQARFHLIDLYNGTSKSFLVSHGSGSDPRHTGWLQRFSNQEGSNASSEGAYLTSNYYVGKHGRSQRLIGLDPTNDQALPRAIVVHAAWYANPSMLQTHGMLGRSQGCFAVGEGDLDEVFRRLGEGRMIYAAKV